MVEILTIIYIGNFNMLVVKCRRVYIHCFYSLLALCCDMVSCLTYPRHETTKNIAQYFDKKISNPYQEFMKKDKRNDGLDLISTPDESRTSSSF
jgi:hypothetical protein